MFYGLLRHLYFYFSRFFLVMRRPFDKHPVMNSLPEMINSLLAQLFPGLLQFARFGLVLATVPCFSSSTDTQNHQLTSYPALLTWSQPAEGPGPLGALCHTSRALGQVHIPSGSNFQVSDAIQFNLNFPTPGLYSSEDLKPGSRSDLYLTNRR